MKLLNKYAVTCGLLAALGLTPLVVQAESNEGNGTGTADAKLNLKVTIPEFLYFRVGTTGTGNVDTITFAPGAGAVGDGTSIAGTGGDAAGSGANVRLRSNAGAIKIIETNNQTTGLLGATTGTSIPLTEISTVVSVDANLLAPALSNGGGTTVSIPLTGGTKVTMRNAVWTYAYNNTTVPDADTYDVQITYTASSL